MERIDRSQVRRVKTDEQETDFAFWQSRTPQERLATLEAIRREYHLWKYGTQPGFQRVFSKFLNKNDVRYLVVGGYAVAFHGHPRYTTDIDVWIDATPENAARLIRALRNFGFASMGFLIEDFLEPGYTIQLGVAPNRIDLLTSAGSLEFDTCFNFRAEAVVGGIKVPMIGLDHLKQNKRAAGRSQDLADLEHRE